MTGLIIVFLIFVALLVFGWCLMLVRIGKAADKAMHEAFKDYTDTQHDPYLDNITKENHENS